MRGFSTSSNVVDSTTSFLFSFLLVIIFLFSKLSLLEIIVSLVFIFALTKLLILSKLVKLLVFVLFTVDKTLLKNGAKASLVILLVEANSSNILSFSFLTRAPILSLVSSATISIAVLSFDGTKNLKPGIVLKKLASSFSSNVGATSEKIASGCAILKKSLKAIETEGPYVLIILKIIAKIIITKIATTKGLDKLTLDCSNLDLCR